MKPLTAGLIGVALGAGAMLALELIPRGSGDKVSPELEKTADSLKATRPAAEDRRDSTLRLVVVDSVRAVRAERLAKARKDTAEAYRKVADSLAALANVYGDSAFLWRDAYENRTAEADQLSQSLAAADSARGAELANAGRFRLLWIDAEARRRAAEEVVIPGLQRSIAQLEKPCRLVGPIRCRSRTETAVLAVLGTVAAVKASK